MSKVLQHIRIASRISIQQAASTLGMDTIQLSQMEQGLAEPTHAVFAYYGNLEEDARLTRNPTAKARSHHSRGEFMRWLYTGNKAHIHPTTTLSKIMFGLFHRPLRSIMVGLYSTAATLTERLTRARQLEV